MQRDFLEAGGFGETLGNDLTPVEAIVPTVAALMALFRAQGWPIVHTRENHAPDLSDCPPAKRLRGKPEPAHRRSRADGAHSHARRARRRHRAGAAAAGRARS